MEENILKEQNFRFKKQFGQNFLTDKNLLKAIVLDAGITNEDEVLEIGAGAGALTMELAKVAKKVVSYEIDNDLKPILEANLKEFNNIELIFNDFLKVKPEELKKHFIKEFKLVANLPYYITTPILFYLLEQNFNVKSITVMVQKEVAERLVSKENTKDYGRLTISANIICDVSIKRIVNRKLFYPAPNVDSAIVHFVVNKNKYGIINEAFLKKLIKSAFSMRRKTLINNLKQELKLSQQELENALNLCNLPLTIRAESLTIQNFITLANILDKTNQKNTL